MDPPVTLSKRLPPGAGQKLPQKVSSSGLLACRMVGEDGTGKRWKTSKD